MAKGQETAQQNTVLKILAIMTKGKNVALLCVIVSILLMIFPILIPVAVGPSATAYYNTIENLPAGSVVLNVHWEDVLPNYCGPGQYATNIHLFKRPVKIIQVGMTAAAVNAYKRMENENPLPAGRVYGVDYVYLPYLPAQ